MSWCKEKQRELSWCGKEKQRELNWCGKEKQRELSWCVIGWLGKRWLVGYPVGVVQPRGSLWVHIAQFAYSLIPSATGTICVRFVWPYFLRMNARRQERVSSPHSSVFRMSVATTVPTLSMTMLRAKTAKA